MKSKITFFPVDNGDMTLIKLSDKTTILVDINLRESSEDEESPAFDAVKGLRDRLEKDDEKDGVAPRLFGEECHALVLVLTLPVNAGRPLPCGRGRITITPSSWQVTRNLRQPMSVWRRAV